MNRSKKFASQADLEEKQISFTKLSEHAYAYTAEGDPNTGIIIGDDAVLVAALPVAEQLATSTGHAVALAVWGNFGPPSSG
jgi:hypothetical protein